LTLGAKNFSLCEAFWASVVGAEVMFMFFTVCPDAKSHFSHFDQSQGSPDLLSHGGKIVNAIGGEIKDLDDLSTVMAALTELHTNKLKVTPEHMEDLSCTILVTLKKYLCMLHDVLLTEFKW
uniref:Globin domain-containing protein n=1 Tax=Leptobrachium leishanense TaxID=445787 RepID=A0A8C5MI75_9ANUR